jgi:hypothetical protein
MSRHRSDLTTPPSAFDFDVVSDPPRPFKVRRDLPAETPPEMPAEAPAEPRSPPASEGAAR